MGCEEMYHEFNLLWNNLMSGQAPGLNRYEVSRLLTQAQETVVVGLYDGAAGDSFEEDEERTRWLAPLVKQATLTEAAEGVPHITAGTSVYTLPGDLLFRTYESCTLTDAEAFPCEGGSVEASVVPVTQDQFWRTYRDPFRGPSACRVLRLAYDTPGAGDGGGNAMRSELVSKYPVSAYLVRYVRRPRPVVLEDLPDGVTVDGVSAVTPCELDPALHRRVVVAAVQVAKAAWA